MAGSPARTGIIALFVVALSLLPVPATAAGPAVGVVDTTTGIWYLRDPAGGTTSFYYGNPGDVPMMGDWDCDGIDTPGLYRIGDGYVYLRNTNSQGIADLRFFFGNPGDLPVAGDFDGDGCDTISIYRPSEARVYLINRLGSGDAGLGPADLWYALGTGNQVPFAADLDGDGRSEVAVHDAAAATVTYRVASGSGTEVIISFGNPDDRVLGMGGTSTILATFRPSSGTFHLASGGEFAYGNGTLLPVSGDSGPLPGGNPAPPVLPTAELTPGSSGPAVARLQQLLASKAFYRGPINGVYSAATQQAVMAFHKDRGLPRQWSWQSGDWAVLAGYGSAPIAFRPNEPFRVEVDLGRQVGYLVEYQAVTAIFPISSGNGALFSIGGGRLARAVTPRGNFRFQRHIPGTRISYLGVLHKPWYFTGGYALHGSPSVPGYPASHGCIRMTNADVTWMDGHFFVGLPVHVY